MGNERERLEEWKKRRLRSQSWEEQRIKSIQDRSRRKINLMKQEKNFRIDWWYLFGVGIGVITLILVILFELITSLDESLLIAIIVTGNIIIVFFLYSAFKKNNGESRLLVPPKFND